MSLKPGTQLGPYEILSPIGAGGMGEVYRAHDPRVGRDVAIKVASEKFSERFDREARAVAALNHLNIATLYDVGPNYLVMELVEGATLAERIEQGAIPLEESLAIARQIADALEAAHEKGIVHRDLKPGNIKLKPDGTVKVLDFGLAKVEEATAVSLENSPTLSVAQTAAGVILGTAAYMSPEQARGKTVDKRADIWAFGVVLYEMLTGKRLFRGETVSDTLAAVLKEEPEWEKVPAKVRPLLGRCLEKDSKKRLRDIGEAMAWIEKAPESVSAKRQWLAWAVAVVLAVALFLSIFLWSPWRTARKVAQPLVRLDVDLGAEVFLGTFGGPDVIISPDGERLVFVSKSTLFIRRLDQSEATELPGTEGASDPFFSPDSQRVAYFAGGKLKEISVEGGTAIVLCDATTHLGGSWGEDDEIIALGIPEGGYLSRISADGGVPKPVTELADGEMKHGWPQILPGGKAVLYTANTSPIGFDHAKIEVMTFTDRHKKTLVREGTYGRYLPSRHLVYLNKGTLFAVPFDLDTLEVHGTPLPVLHDVIEDRLGGGKLDFSGSGTLIYRRGGSVGGDLLRLHWLDSTGKTLPMPVKPSEFLDPRLSPDGKVLALAVISGGTSDIMTYDLQRDATTRLTFASKSFTYPVWSPDGRFIVFCMSGGGGMFWTRADGAGKVQPLIQSRNIQIPYSFYPDGKWLAFAEMNSQSVYALWIVQLEDHGGQLKAGQPESFLQTSGSELFPAFSPDGHWIAYRSDTAGTNEIFVRSFPKTEGQWQISNGGGVIPIWSKNGHELFYRTEDQGIMVVTYTVKGDSFVADKPRLWTDTRLADTFFFPNLDITPDGKRFVVLMPAEGSEEQKAQNHVTFLLNFFDELRRRVPTGAR